MDMDVEQQSIVAWRPLAPLHLHLAVWLLVVALPPFYLS
jgi:hypothetical protein